MPRFEPVALCRVDALLKFLPIICLPLRDLCTQVQILGEELMHSGDFREVLG